MVQRALTCRGQAGGRMSLLLSAALNVPIVLLFLSVGSMLWLTLGQEAGVQQAILEIEKLPGVREGQGMDYVFPWWVLENLPAGLKGLIFAGLFAAAMSSLDSAIAALSSTAVKNVYEPYFAPAREEAHYLRASRVFAAIFGVLLVGVAVVCWLTTDAGEGASQGFGVLKLGLKVLSWIFPAAPRCLPRGCSDATRSRRDQSARSLCGSRVAAACRVLGIHL